MSGINRILEWIGIKESRKDRVIRMCGCVCYCPSCKDILNDQAECTDEDVVTYHCKCGHKSRWLFDAPVPILLKAVPS